MALLLIKRSGFDSSSSFITIEDCANELLLLLFIKILLGDNNDNDKGGLRLGCGRLEPVSIPFDDRLDTSTVDDSVTDGDDILRCLLKDGTEDEIGAVAFMDDVDDDGGGDNGGVGDSILLLLLSYLVFC